jgi:PDZ domain-containing protein
MVTVPAPYRHASSGSFLMTTVVEQTPIVAGQWVYAHLSSGSEIVAPERLLPSTTTLQERMHHNYELLEQSEQTATIVALRLAGYHTVVQGTEIEVVNVRPTSWASQALQPGDRILRLNGAPLHDTTDLFAQLRTHESATLLDMELVRNSMLLHLRSTFTPELAGSDAPDIVVRTGQPYTDAPFPVTITPQKIFGGPSVGLMFTLTVYDTLTPEDLTGGRRIAGTGTIDLDGTVGPIGGVAQKVAAAEAAGADYFLVPTANAADARRTAHHMQVIEVATVEEAIQMLHTLPPMDSQS